MPTDSGGGGGAAPDYRGAAEEQAQASREIATQTTFANRPTLNTPWGQMTWGTEAGVDPATGQPITNWTGNLNLTPEQQVALDSQQRIQQGRSTGAETLLPQAVGNFQQQFNWAGLPQAAATPGVQRTGTTTGTTNEPAFAAQRQQIQNALFEQMRPEHARQEESARVRLANQGLAPGSEAYNRELERLQGTQAAERFNAMQTAGTEQARMQQMLLGQQQQAFTQGAGANQQNFQQMMNAADYQNKLRQQGITEEQLRRGLTLNELNALLTGQQVQNPQMPQFNTATQAQAPNYLGAAQMQGDYNTANRGGGTDLGSLLGTGLGIAGQAGLFSGAAGAGSAAAMASGAALF